MRLMRRWWHGVHGMQAVDTAEATVSGHAQNKVWTISK